MTLSEIIKYVNSAPEDELDMISKRISTARDNRANQRKKELWGNVVAAIRKYEQEIEPIQILLPDRDDEARIVNVTHPGGIVTEYV